MQNKLTAPEALEKHIKKYAAEHFGYDPDGDEDEQYGAYHDAQEEIRGGEEETGLPSDYSRHYESKSVAAKTEDGWLGWIYWYGGGKHGEPESIDWIEDAYFLDCHEEEKLVKVKTFSKK